MNACSLSTEDSDARAGFSGFRGKNFVTFHKIGIFKWFFLQNNEIKYKKFELHKEKKINHKITAQLLAEIHKLYEECYLSYFLSNLFFFSYLVEYVLHNNNSSNNKNSNNTNQKNIQKMCRIAMSYKYNRLSC